MRDDLIRIITDGLQWLLFKLEGRTVARLYDLNVVSEDFVMSFINRLRDLHLVNLNVGSVHHPAIDLGDKKNRISFQVTSQRSAKKIQDGLDKFDENGFGSDYDQIFFFLLNRKQKTYKGVRCKTIQFDPKKHIVDVPDVIRELSGADIGRLKALAGIIQDEGLLPSEPVDSDEVAIRKIHSHFNRDALKHRWKQEGPIPRFESALNDLTELLGKGTVQGKKITKPLHLIADKRLANDLAALNHALGQLRALFNEAINSKEIGPDRQFAFFHHRENAEKMNEAKLHVIKAANKIGQRYHLPVIEMYDPQF